MMTYNNVGKTTFLFYNLQWLKPLIITRLQTISYKKTLNHLPYFSDKISSILLLLSMNAVIDSGLSGV